MVEGNHNFVANGRRLRACELRARLEMGDLSAVRFPEPGQFGHGSDRRVEPLCEPLVSQCVGMEIVGIDGQTGRIEPVVGVGHVDKLREPHGLRRLLQGSVVGTVVGPSDARDEHPDNRYGTSRGSLPTMDW